MKFSPPFFSVFYTFFIVLSLYSGFVKAAFQTTEERPEEQQKNQSFQLLMVGGGLKVCSGSNIQHCETSIIPSLAEKQKSTRYELSEKSFSAVLQMPEFQSLPEETQKQLGLVFQHFYANPLNVNSPEEIRQAFNTATQEFDAGSLFSNLPNAVYYAILDFTRQTVQVQPIVKLAHSKSIATRNIIGEFIRQAEQKLSDDTVLKLAFMTSGDRDPFASVAYYQQVFEQAASEAKVKDFSVNWLPLDKSLMLALQDKAKGLNSCQHLGSYRRQQQLFNSLQRYPELSELQKEMCKSPDKLIQQLQNSHGLFIAGDAPMRSLSIFRDAQFEATDYQKIIQQKVQNGSLFLAGNDVGTAILAGGVFDNRPVPFITGGTSEVALIRGAFAASPVPFGCEKDGNCPYGLLEDDLTFESRGGIGNFNLGVVDTRFSELNREARLAVLTATSKTRFGFGIDENTALLVSHTPDDDKTMKVIGENGVFVVDMRDAIVKTQSGKHQIIGMSHYINDSDQISYSASNKELNFRFAPDSAKITGKTMILPSGPGEFRRNVAINCGTTSFHRWTENNIAWLVNPTEDTEFYVNSNGEMEKCSYNHLLFGIEN